MKAKTVQLDHGAGGRASRELVEEVFAPELGGAALGQMDDAAVLPRPAGRLAVSTDTFTVQPLFFPGGDIGSLAVHGTVNDVAMRGGQPLYLTAGFVLEEGLEIEVLRRVAASLAKAAARAGVEVVAADTKVVGRGQADGLYINTTGIGVIPEGREVGAHLARPGDVVLISGTVGDHGVTVMAERGGLGLTTPVESDSAALAGLLEAVWAAAPGVRVLRDPTRGGLATALKEIALSSGVAMELEENAVPIRPGVAAACEILGLDPLYLANEGKAIVIAPQEEANNALAALRDHELGREAAVIGQCLGEKPGMVWMNTSIGGRRVLDMLTGEPLPRIC